MAAKTAKRPPARRKPPARRTSTVRRPSARRSWDGALGAWLGRWIARMARRRAERVRTRKDAAILRATHQGCPKCHGTGTVFTKAKDGTFSGSRPCPAKPTTMTVNRARIHAQARFGVDKDSGLIGWRCPCGAKEKPRYRDAKTATSALRAHERKRHAGVSVGGAWFAQLPEGTDLTKITAPAAKPRTKPGRS